MISLDRYVASHGSKPAADQFGQWILENADGSRSISRTCYFRQLATMKLEFFWFLLP